MIDRIDHTEQSKELMLSQFENSPDVNALLQSWLKPLQGIEDDIIEFMKGNGISSAKGVMLDTIGSWMGVKRQGRSDNEYRTIILGRVVTEFMDGTTESFYTGFRTLTGSNLVQIYFYYPNDLYAVAGSGYSPVLEEELKKIAQAGTNVNLIVAKDLNYMTVGIRGNLDDSLVTDSDDPYEVLVGGDVDALSTSYAYSAAVYGTDDTTGWSGLDLPNAKPLAFGVTPFKMVNGYVTDQNNNQIVDDKGNPVIYYDQEGT